MPSAPAPGHLRQRTHDAATLISPFDDEPDVEQCPEFFAAARLDLMTAHLALSNLDGAEAHFQPMFALPTENRTVPVVKRMKATDQ
ncbi:hypothetical protein QTQ03_21175 [Micromonospora sp. WMMA1363]|uniref:hypothetical protein n=1 Tax=Micromonospora sp. WMMA1363 TaxID=3053985 RepID=UPI00259CFDFB|nr:hypothetical protein [Micromonospora sp. WMMA1363]MDM4721979.1 hypothetical protein [Micromonospora sp. WMMA1363]